MEEPPMSSNVINTKGSIKGFGNYAFGAKCSYCGESVGFNVCYAQQIQRKVNDEGIEEKYQYYFFVGTCPNCGHPAIAIGRKLPDLSNHYIVDKVYPQKDTIKVPEGLTDHIEKLYVEAANVFYDKRSPQIASVSCRMLLEAACKDRLPEYFKKGLKNTIKSLGEDCIIPQTLVDLADTIRIIGNEAAHEVIPVEQEEAETIWEFTNIFLEYLYALPYKIDRLRNKR
jgi:hypothetical protein